MCLKIIHNIHWSENHADVELSVTNGYFLSLGFRLCIADLISHIYNFLFHLYRLLENRHVFNVKVSCRNKYFFFFFCIFFFLESFAFICHYFSETNEMCVALNHESDMSNVKKKAKNTQTWMDYPVLTLGTTLSIQCIIMWWLTDNE